MTLDRLAVQWRSDATVMAAVDGLVVAGLVVYGQLSHGFLRASEPLAAVESIVPFVIGWYLVAGLGGIYAGTHPGSILTELRLVLVCWLAAANVGFFLRGSAYFAGGVPWEFTVVFTGIGIVAIVSGRAIAWTLLHR